MLTIMMLDIKSASFALYSKRNEINKNSLLVKDSLAGVLAFAIHHTLYSSLKLK